MKKGEKKLKVAFVIGIFPAISETFIINQIADLEDGGVDVEIFSFVRGSEENISERYRQYEMFKGAHYLNMPSNWLKRIAMAAPKMVRLIFKSPRTLFRALNFSKYGRDALSLKFLFWVEPFVGRKFDLIHCHFGPIANKFLIIKDILGDDTKMITSFLGYDVSSYTKEKGPRAYNRLKEESSAFIVMSNNMKERVVAQGFDESKITVLPISIDVDSYPFETRELKEGEEIKMVSVGRFVEKKGFDDLLRALAIVRERTAQKFKCAIVGDGPLREEIYKLTDEFKLNDIVDFRGFMKMEDVIDLFMKNHFYLQPSKTASNGDME